MAHTKVVGNTSEAFVLAGFLSVGFQVCVPFGEGSRYDLVVDAGGHLLRVQCKTASKVPGMDALRFKARSVRKDPGSNVIVTQTYRDQADLFAAYSPVTGKVYVLPVDECPVTDVWLRLTPAKNNQQIGIRMAEEHTLEAWAARYSASSPSGVLSAAGRL